MTHKTPAIDGFGGGKAFWENVTLTLCTIRIQMEMLHERNGYFPVSGVAIPPTP